jgi:hypothetical protein
MRGLIEGVRCREATSATVRAIHWRRCKSLTRKAIQEDPDDPVLRAYRLRAVATVPGSPWARAAVQEDLALIRGRLEDQQGGGLGRGRNPRERAFLKKALAEWMASQKEASQRLPEGSGNLGKPARTS